MYKNIYIIWILFYSSVIFFPRKHISKYTHAYLTRQIDHKYLQEEEPSGLINEFH